MEGRNPPPKAEHPWPGEVRFDNVRQNARHILKYAFFFTLVAGPYAYLSAYLHRNATHFLGNKVVFTEEEMKKKKDLAIKAPRLKTLPVPILLPSQKEGLFTTSGEEVDTKVETLLPGEGALRRGQKAT